MKFSPGPAFVFVALSALLGGCSHAEDADTSPLPPKDPQASVESAANKIESSNMTPEQKQAAIDYLKQGANNAQQLKKQAPPR